jgi:hypothetical protein
MSDSPPNTPPELPPPPPPPPLPGPDLPPVPEELPPRDPEHQPGDSPPPMVVRVAGGGRRRPNVKIVTPLARPQPRFPGVGVRSAIAMAGPGA